jgi:hypothetical protein
VFRTKQFLVDHFQTVQGVVSFLGAYDAPLPNAAAVQKWFERGSIPSDWLPLLLCYLEIENGTPVSLRGYVGGVHGG